MAPHESPILREVKAKHPWPPDFSKMGDVDKYRLERKYKRRMRKGYPAGWMKFTGMLQLLTLTALPAYMVLFMDWGDMRHPFDPLRNWMWDKIDTVVGSNRGLSRGSATVPNRNQNPSSERESK